MHLASQTRSLGLSFGSEAPLLAKSASLRFSAGSAAACAFRAPNFIDSFRNADAFVTPYAMGALGPGDTGVGRWTRTLWLWTGRMSSPAGRLLTSYCTTRPASVNTIDLSIRVTTQWLFPNSGRKFLKNRLCKQTISARVGKGFYRIVCNVQQKRKISLML